MKYCLLNKEQTAVSQLIGESISLGSSYYTNISKMTRDKRTSLGIFNYIDAVNTTVDRRYYKITTRIEIDKDKSIVSTVIDSIISVPVDQAKTIKQQEILANFITATNLIKRNYTDNEVATWDQQIAEAKAYLLDSTVSVPMIDSIAASRGITKAELAEKILAKATAYATVIGNTLGKKQILEKAIESATAVEEIIAISW